MEPKTNADATSSESHCYASRPYAGIIKKRRDKGTGMAVRKHTAANAVFCQRVIDELDAAGMQEAADWAVWILWHRTMDWQTSDQVNQMYQEEIQALRARIDTLEREKRGAGQDDLYA